MTANEIDTLEDYEIDAYYKIWKDREQRTDRRIAAVISALGNIIYSSQGIKQRFKQSDFLKTPQRVNPMSADELRNLAILAFGPPPKKED